MGWRTSRLRLCLSIFFLRTTLSVKSRDFDFDSVHPFLSICVGEDRWLAKSLAQTFSNEF